jgi:hypothetical protein
MSDRAATLAPSPALAGVFLDPGGLPRRYALKLAGRCPLPPLPTGATVHFDTAEPFAAGDLALLFFRPAAVAQGRPWRVLRRVLTEMPVCARLTESPLANVRAGLLLAADAPDQALFVPCADLAAVHRATGFTVRGGAFVPLHRAP